jgi:2-amino-4-hydroxy-6-hydroxymethyldihydropteridine diphosphokinase
MPEVLVGLGSNQEPITALRAAVAALERSYGRLACSGVYRGAAVGLAAAEYLNMVVGFAAGSDVDTVRAELARIEAATGRNRADPRVCRLDLDLLVHGARVDASRRLPRPGLFSMPFVLLPLAEIAPHLVHPLTGERCGVARAAFVTPIALEALGPLR